MKIAMVSPYDLSMPGGVQAQVLGLATALAKRGDRVVVIAPGEPNDLMAEGVEMRSVGRSIALPVNGSRAPVSPTPLAMSRAVRALTDAEVDVAHVHEPLVPGPALAVTLRAQAPVIGTFHRARASRTYQLYARGLAQTVREMSDRVAVSEVAAATLRAGVGDVSLDIIPNAIDLSRFVEHVDVEHNPPRVLFIGRIEHRKGCAELLEACTELGDDFALRVIGDGPERAALARRSRDDHRVQWLGRLSDDGRDRELLRADVLVAPALGGESFGVVLLEAMAARCAILASDLPGYRTAAGDAAHYVAPGDIPALRHGLEALLVDANERQRLVTLGQARVKEFTFARVAATYAARYTAL